jgi:hypothetical protein
MGHGLLHHQGALHMEPISLRVSNHLHSQLSTESSEKLKRVAGWLRGLRRSLMLCNACMDSCGDEQNELRLVLPEMLKSLMDMLYYVVNKLLNSSSGTLSIDMKCPDHQFDAH